MQSCAVGPEYVKPEYEMPDIWQARLVEGLAVGEAPMATWWRVLNDRDLDTPHNLHLHDGELVVGDNAAVCFFDASGSPLRKSTMTSCPIRGS